MLKNYKNALPLWLCVSLILASANLHAQLKANFTISPDSFCTNLLDSFPNTTTGGTLPYTYFWDYGNGETSTSMIGYVNYSTSGNYNIKLRITDAKGTLDSITKSIVVIGSPDAIFYSMRKGCGLVTFHANIGSSSTKISQYLWVGEGPPGFGPLYLMGDSGKYLYTKSGTYHYTLILTGTNGCKVTYFDSIKIPPYPLISTPYDSASICKNNSISITATPSNGTPPYSVWWGNKSANLTKLTINPTITKDTSLGVNVLDSNGCYNYDSIYIHAYPLPNAHWTMNYKVDSIEFKAKDEGFKDSAYSWIFLYDHNYKDIRRYGSIIGQVFPSDSIYNTELQITDTNGCFSYFDSTINVAKLGYNSYIANNLLLKIYPNPFTSSTNIAYTLTQKSDVKLELNDMTGRQLMSINKESQLPGTYQAEINTDKYHLTPGVYILKFMTNDGFVSRNILKF